MNQNQVLSTARTAMKIVGTYLVTKGITDSTTAETATGGILALIGIVWSWTHHGGGAGCAMLLACALALGSGCSTTSSGQKVLDQQKAAQFAPVLAAAASDAVIYAYQKNPGSAAYIGAIREAVNQFALSSDFSPEALEAALRSLPIKELKTPEAQMILTPVLAAYKVYADEIVKQAVSAKLDANPGLKALINAILTGIDTGEKSVKQLQSSADVRPVAVNDIPTELDWKKIRDFFQKKGIFNFYSPEIDELKIRYGLVTNLVVFTTPVVFPSK